MKTLPQAECGHIVYLITGCVFVKQTNREHCIVHSLPGQKEDKVWALSSVNRVFEA